MSSLSSASILEERDTVLEHSPLVLTGSDEATLLDTFVVGAGNDLDVSLSSYDGKVNSSSMLDQQESVTARADEYLGAPSATSQINAVTTHDDPCRDFSNDSFSLVEYLTVSFVERSVDEISLRQSET